MENNHTLSQSSHVSAIAYLIYTYRTTPIDSNLPSPAKVLNQRDYRTQLPCSGRLQRSQTMECNQTFTPALPGVQKYYVYL